MDILLSKFHSESIKHLDTKDKVTCAKHCWILQSYKIANQAKSNMATHLKIGIISIFKRSFNRKNTSSVYTTQILTTSL